MHPASRRWTPISVGIGGRAATFVDSGAIRPLLREAIHQLRLAGANPVLMTGDNRRAEAALGLVRGFAEVPPRKWAFRRPPWR